MDYQWFLDNGWPINEIDRHIAQRWRESGRPGSIPLRKLNHVRYRLLCEADRFPTVVSATDEWFPTPPPPAPTPVDFPPRLEARHGARF